MALWTPANLTDGSLDLWWDANNSASITLSGSNVTNWKDLAHGLATASAGTTPTLVTNSLNGLPGVSFAGGGRFTAATTSVGKFHSAMTSLIVYTDTADGNFLNIFSSTQSSGNGIGVGHHNDSPASICTTEIGIQDNFSTATVTVSTPTLVEVQTPAVTGGTTWGAASVWKNGNVGGGIAGMTITAFTQTGFNLGGDASGDNFITGLIYEAVILNANITISDRQLLEGYLCWKWGLQAQLPGGHPYASAAPQAPGGSSDPPFGLHNVVGWNYR